jgi:hypothetical protein
VIAQAAALVLIYSPDYLAGIALRFMLKPDHNMEELLVQEVGREKADEMLKEIRGAQSGAPAKPGDFSAALHNVFSKTQLEEKKGLEKAQYDQYSSIMFKYQTELSGIQGEYEQKLNDLVGSLKQEYRQEGSKNPVSVRKLAEKYRATGQALEANCDQRFNDCLSAMEMELKANNLPTGAVANARSAYIVMKDNYREEILNKAMEVVRGNK